MAHGGGTLDILDEAPARVPRPMTDREAYSAARRIGAAWTLARRGKACAVFRRVKGGGAAGRPSAGRGVRRGPCLGMGPTWEAAFDAALANEGR